MSGSAAFIAKLVACGIKASGLTVAEAHDLPPTISIGQKAEATNQHFQCIYDAHVPINVTFSDPALDREYERFARNKFNSDRRLLATQWLTNSGKLDGVPLLTSFERPADWAAAVEKHCGVPHGEAIEFLAPTLITLSASYDTVARSPAADCVLFSLLFSNLEERDIELELFPRSAEDDL